MYLPWPVCQRLSFSVKHKNLECIGDNVGISGVVKFQKEYTCSA